MNCSVEDDVGLCCPNSFFLMLVILQLCCDLYDPLVVAVLSALLAIDVALSALLYAILWSWPCRHYLKYCDGMCSWFMWSMSKSIYMWSNVKVCVLSMYVRRSCGVWLCSYMCNLICWYMIVPTWLYELWWLYWWWYSNV